MAASSAIWLVCGGREFEDADAVFGALMCAAEERGQPAMLIHGGYRGVDLLAAEWARENGVHSAEVLALWDEYGKAAGPKRNAAMLLLRPDLVIAFPGRVGTADMVRKAVAAGVEVLKWNY